ncbi:hypothetical protein HPB49_002186 [Dermacentor silvarum]|uniref:Uncharacterized protein n=1 Tax=Dermacentor silvarum TaxID=543639 RepID=A0ACB8D284_DERSI|nr:hypothetical protein HPB49_002186 [Dermacentor silvarum]
MHARFFESQCSVLRVVSSTRAELAAIDLAVELLLQLPVQRAAVLRDSRAALCMLAREDHGPTLIRQLQCKLDGVCERGCDLIFQWVPSHVCLQGNEEADRLAKEAHSSSVPLSRFVTRFDIARHSHPDPRVAGGVPPKLLPRRGLSRRDRALILRLRIGCGRTAERLHWLSGEGSPSCDGCADIETVEHALLQCPARASERRALVTAYRRLGLPADTTQQLLFPATHLSIARHAFSALLVYLEDANLRARLAAEVPSPERQLRRCTFLFSYF